MDLLTPLPAVADEGRSIAQLVPDPRTNFGQNVRIEPGPVVTPTTEPEVLAAMRRYRGRRIRVLGSLHSWSEAAAPDDIAFDLRHFNEIKSLAAGPNGVAYVEVGAGCTVERLLDYLHVNGRYTLPVYGVIGKQTVAGAISTGTHGSGRSSMSHYVTGISAAVYDEKGNPIVQHWTGGDSLEAARCGLGCTGVILSVRLQVEPDFQIEERSEWFDRLDPLLAEALAYPRTQFYLIPWEWRWYAQLRRPVAPDAARPPGILARVLRVFRFIVVDILLNGTIRFLAATPRRRRYLPWLFQRVVPRLAPPGVRVTDDSRRLLTVRHDLFTHVECEIFVPAANLSAAATLVEWALRCCGGEETPPGTDAVDQRFGADLLAEIDPLRGEHIHDYPITFRRVLRDDTLISMTSGDTEEWYAISLITHRPDLTAFLRLVRLLSKTMARTLGGRPHWGKLCLLQTGEVAALYPRMSQFRAHCASIDPAQTFVNDYARLNVGFKPEDREPLPRDPRA